MPGNLGTLGWSLAGSFSCARTFDAKSTAMDPAATRISRLKFSMRHLEIRCVQLRESGCSRAGPLDAAGVTPILLPTHFVQRVAAAMEPVAKLPGVRN